MESRRCAVGVDLGGQSFKLALVDATGEIHLRNQTSVDAAQPAEAIADLMVSEVRKLLAASKDQGWSPSGVGIVMPGYMDVGRTKILFAANLPTLNGSDFLTLLRQGIDLPVSFDADCNAAAVGEHRFGAGRGIERLIVATVGTGIGAAVLIQGRILRLWNHISGSLGHVIVDAKGTRCACGGRGCVEALASGRAVEKLAADLVRAEPESRLAALQAERGQLTGVEIGLALQDRDPAAMRVVNECGWWLGAGIASWSVIYAPEKVLIGGGIALLGPPLLEAVRQGLRDVGQPHTTRKVRVDVAALGSDAGVIGAAAMVMPD